MPYNGIGRLIQTELMMDLEIDQEQATLLFDSLIRFGSHYEMISWNVREPHVFGDNTLTFKNYNINMSKLGVVAMSILVGMTPCVVLLDAIMDAYELNDAMKRLTERQLAILCVLHEIKQSYKGPVNTVDLIKRLSENTGNDEADIIRSLDALGDMKVLRFRSTTIVMEELHFVGKHDRPCNKRPRHVHESVYDFKAHE